MLGMHFLQKSYCLCLASPNIVAKLPPTPLLNKERVPKFIWAGEVLHFSKSFVLSPDFAVCVALFYALALVIFFLAFH